MLREYMFSLGYSDKDIDKFIGNRKIKKYREENLVREINDIFEYLLIIGYKNEEIVMMTKRNFKFFSLSIDCIKFKFESLILLGYSNNDIIRMSIRYPMLYSMSIDNFAEKKKFYDQIGLGDVIVNEPSCLMQSVDLSYARYMFYYKIGIKITKMNCSLLFLSQDAFVRRFGKTNEQLIKMYNYDEYLEKRKIMAKKK